MSEDVALAMAIARHLRHCENYRGEAEEFLAAVAEFQAKHPPPTRQTTKAEDEERVRFFSLYCAAAPPGSAASVWYTHRQMAAN